MSTDHNRDNYPTLQEIRRASWVKGRGADSNPANRFERLAYTPDPEAYDPEAPAPATELYHDATRSLLTRNDTPDLPFEYSLNPYRGCEHGWPC